MYKHGRRKRNLRIYFYSSLALIFLSGFVIVGVIIFLNFQPVNTAEIKNIAEKNKTFDPANSNDNLKVDTPLYTMELPKNWKQISENKDPKYSSIEWLWDAKTKNRSLEIFVDSFPINKPLNKIMPVTVQENTLITDTISDNCSKFTSKINDSNLKVASKWQDVHFLCDLDNMIDNVIGIGTVNDGVIIPLHGPLKGTHKYMFVYTDRSIPENSSALNTALKTFKVK